jgi:16S rRNA (guanine1207-N2)-methyltransferase
MTKRERGPDHYFAAHPTSEVKLGIIQTALCGVSFCFLTASSVFSKKRLDPGTRLLIEAMVLPKAGCVLDVGCGYGAVGIAAAKFNPALRVLLTDVNTRAVGLARENIVKNKVQNSEVRYGCLYQPVEDLTFDCVLSNPPVSAGMETVKAIITEAPKVMAEKATIQMVIRSRVCGKILPIVFEETFGNCEVLARQSGYRVLMAQKR